MVRVRALHAFLSWRPGDLILVSALTPNRVQLAIERVQCRGGYHPHHARWQHAAVYIGDYYICESTHVGGLNPQPYFPILVII
jgi:hypothetical protein